MKYNITMGCGHTETIQLCGKHVERDRKLQYLQDYGICKECYKSAIREQERKQGLLLHAHICTYMEHMNGNIYLYLWFSGDTMTHKDEIKSSGYHWDGECWSKQVKLQDFQGEAVHAASIGAKKARYENRMHYTEYYPIEIQAFKSALEEQKKWYDMHDKISAIKKPDKPEIVAGHYWNQKIYGKHGQHRIYLDKKETFITDEDALQIKKYLDEKNEYSKKVEEIKNAHK